VKVLSDSREIFTGKLYVDDFFFDGEDEVPVFKIVLEDGKTMSFADNHKWKFLENKRQTP
jgi:hypothetical protein